MIQAKQTSHEKVQFLSLWTMEISWRARATGRMTNLSVGSGATPSAEARSRRLLQGRSQRRCPAEKEDGSHGGDRRLCGWGDGTLVTNYQMV